MYLFIRMYMWYKTHCYLIIFDWFLFIFVLFLFYFLVPIHTSKVSRSNRYLWSAGFTLDLSTII